MTRVMLVRHGQAAAGWDDDLDPGLSPSGQAQALRLAEVVGPSRPLPILTSPLRRARETAAPLELAWGSTATVAPTVGEIMSPAPGLRERGAWLREVMGNRWADLGHALNAWRAAVLDTIGSVEEDTVIVSHFIAINVVVGAATGDDRVVCFAPDNCSRTVVDVSGGSVRLVDLGVEARSTVVR